MAQRGRPRKTPVVAEAPAENISEVTNSDETASMKEQVAYQLATILKMAEKMGINLEEVFPKPPAAVNVVEGTSNADIAAIAAQAAIAAMKATSPAVPALKPGEKLKPGQALPGGGWVQWTKGDLNPEDTITFVPLPIPGMVYPFADDNGYQKIKLDINGLVCWLTCGVENTVNRFFYNVYEAALAGHRQLEKFKREGPEWAPWGKYGPDGRQAWQFIPMAASFGMNEDGRSLRVGGPTPLDITPTEVAEASTPTGEPLK